MGKIIGKSRVGYEMSCLDEQIAEYSKVRFIDKLVDLFDLDEMGFVRRESKQYGRNAYGTKVLVKIYLYAYMNRTRSSRQIEKQCRLNIELHWLTEYLTPSYKTISEFRKDNVKALKSIFKEVNKLIVDLGLYAEETTVAVDGTRMKGQNSKLNNYNEKKLNSLIIRGEKEIEKYITDLAENDKLEGEANIVDEKIQEKFAILEQRLTKNKLLKEELIKSEDTQISTVDKDARRMGRLRDGSIVGYNAQTTVCSGIKTIVAADVKNEPDATTLSGMSISAKETMGKELLDVLADAGFDNGEELYNCEQNGMTTYVPSRPSSNSKKKDRISKDDFTYNKEENYYLCPNQKQLSTNNNWYTQKKKGYEDKRYKDYRGKPEDCLGCPKRESCLPKKKLENNDVKTIRKYEYEEYRIESDKRIKADKEKYKMRKATVEHPYGTIKRSWGFDYFLLKGLKKVNGEFNLICACYNLVRLIELMGIEELLKLVKKNINTFIAMLNVYKAPRWRIKSNYRVLHGSSL